MVSSLHVTQQQLRIGNLVIFRETIAPQLFRIADLNGSVADLEPVSLGTTPVQSPVRELRRYRVKTTDEVYWNEEVVQVLRLVNPRSADLYEYDVEVNGEVLRAREVDLRVAPGSALVDPLSQMINLDAAPARLGQARSELLRSYFAATAKSLGIVGYNGARMLPIPHQISAARYALLFGRLRFLLADEVGLGKTVEAGLIVTTLRKYFPEWSTAIFVPDSLTVQWAFEMFGKFGKAIYDVEGLDFDSDDFAAGEEADVAQGTILPHHRAVQWDREGFSPEILVIDEAHQITADPALAEAFENLSSRAQAVLLLTATPTSEGSINLARLLRICDPHHFAEMGDDEEVARRFNQENDFRSVYFALRDSSVPPERIQELVASTPLPDPDVTEMIVEGGINLDMTERIRAATALAEGAMPSVQVLRYRRDYLALHNDLPERVEEPLEYRATAQEDQVRRVVRRWLDAVKDCGHRHSADWQAVAAALMQASHSSPGAVQQWIAGRRDELGFHGGITADPVFRNRKRLAELPVLTGEESILAELEKANKTWARETKAMDVKARPLARHPRFEILLKQLSSIFEFEEDAHLLIFTSFECNVKPLHLLLKKALGPKRDVFAISAEMPWRDREKTAFSFQEKRGPCVLVSDDLGGEGRNFQFANAIFHFDLPLAPWILEQRIGRLDRVGREEEMDVDSQILISSDGPDHTIYEFLRDGVGVFNESIAPIEGDVDSAYRRMIEAFIAEGDDAVLDLIEKVSEELDGFRQEREADPLLTRDLENIRSLSKQLDDREELDRLRAAAIEYTRLLGSVVDEERSRVTITVGAHHPLHAYPGILPEMRGYFDRRLAVRRERLEFFSPGHPFLRALARTAMEESADRVTFSLRQGIPLGAFVFTFRISLPPEYIGAVRDMPEDLQPALLCAAASNFSTHMVRVAVDFKGDLVPENEKTEAVFLPWRSSDLSLDEGEDIYRYLPENWEERCYLCCQVAEARARKQGQRMLEAGLGPLKLALAEALTRAFGINYPIEEQMESLLFVLDEMSVDMDSVAVHFPA
ncbi:MAG: helicase-related protein [Sumerlaeia bacterium]